ncbi:MAG: hypothetical protein Q7U84_08150 [Polynucleobacter sp.]|nr:hypothetical protein [Polynucleobacter sp.]
MLEKQEIESLNLVQDIQANGQRASTYDATVGNIVVRGKIINEEAFTLEPRHIAWVISKESFNLPNNITGLATLRTGWTHRGVLALNVGIVDPGWHGPLGTIIVNFSNVDFDINKGEPFLRLLFHKHADTDACEVKKSQPDYIKDIRVRSNLFSDTFLDMGSLADDVAKKIFALPKLVVVLTFIGLIIAVMALFVPIAWDVWSKYEKNNAQLTAELDVLKEQVKSLQEEKKLAPVVAQNPDKPKSSPPHATGKGEN